MVGRAAPRLMLYPGFMFVLAVVYGHWVPTLVSSSPAIDPGCLAYGPRQG